MTAPGTAPPRLGTATQAPGTGTHPHLVTPTLPLLGTVTLPPGTHHDMIQATDTLQATTPDENLRRLLILSVGRSPLPLLAGAARPIALDFPRITHVGRGARSWRRRTMRRRRGGGG